MKKIFLKMLVACLLISSLNIALFAETKTLWRVTDTTYVESKHSRSRAAFIYYGTASVRGADRGWEEGKLCYYRWTKITYNVQGDISRAIAYSKNRNDYNQVVKRVTVFDKFNYGPVTTAKYNYSALPVDNLPDTFKKQMKPIYGGGILSERKIIQGGRNFR